MDNTTPRNTRRLHAAAARLGAAMAAAADALPGELYDDVAAEALTAADAAGGMPNGVLNIRGLRICARHLEHTVATA